MKLGVIFGGASTEHDVSIVSGSSIIKNLNKSKYEIFPIYIDKNGDWYEYTEKINNIEIFKIGEKPNKLNKIENILEYLKKLEIIFPALHGLYGEDGTIQGMLEILKIPYVGCKVLSSSISMDKAYTKIILEKAKIKQANYCYIRKNKEKYIFIEKNFSEQEYSLNKIVVEIEKNINYPMFVKPSNSGSSIGISKVNNIKELEKAISLAQEFDNKIIIEQGIIGREFECAILGNEEVKASCVGEVLSAQEFYNFDAKYKNSASKTKIPAQISKEKSKEIQKTAIKAYKAVDAKGLARVDFFIENNTNQVYINEINTMPGFTKISMYPKLWEVSGIEYSDLLDELIKIALNERK